MSSECCKTSSSTEYFCDKYISSVDACVWHVFVGILRDVQVNLAMRWPWNEYYTLFFFNTFNVHAVIADGCKPFPYSFSCSIFEGEWSDVDAQIPFVSIGCVVLSCVSALVLYLVTSSVHHDADFFLHFPSQSPRYLYMVLFYLWWYTSTRYYSFRSHRGGRGNCVTWEIWLGLCTL